MTDLLDIFDTNPPQTQTTPSSAPEAAANSGDNQDFMNIFDTNPPQTETILSASPEAVSVIANSGDNQDFLDIDTTGTNPPQTQTTGTPTASPKAVADIANSGDSNTCNNMIDVSLLRGLEPALSTEEQARLTSLLTSGNPDDLATAAKVFHDVGVMLKAGVYSPSQRSDYQCLQMRDTFSTGGNTIKSRPGYNNREERVADEKKINDVIRAEKARALPLPVRVPRMLVLSSAFDATSSKKKPLTFLDDPWDGTLGAAFTKLEVHSDAKGLSKILPARKQKATSYVEHALKFTPGVDTIVDSMPGGYSAQLVEGLAGDTEQPRVLVATVAKEAAKLGLAQRGDVVTHVNGKQFKGTAQDLNELITNLYSNDDPNPLEIVVNAEVCIAKALQLRANLME